MKRVLFGSLVACLLSCGAALAQRGTAEATIGGKSVSIEYGRPSLQGRDMLSRLGTGQTWRMGMNEATMLNTKGTLKFGDQTVAPGSYRLTAKKISERVWHLIINQDSGNVEVPLVMTDVDSVEKLTIKLESKGGNKAWFSMAWGTKELGAAFTVQ